MKTIIVITPPVSINRLYKGRKILTDFGRETKEAYAKEIAMYYKQKDLIEKDDVELSIIFYFSSKRPDIDGCLKALLDSMQGIVYKNDRQISDLHVSRRKDDKNPRIEISVL